MNRTTTANRGRSLEAAVQISQKHLIRVDKLTASVKFLKGGKPILQKGPVDYVGEIVATGRAIHFDAKQTVDVNGFRLGDIAPHQILHLERHHDAKAVTGILAECTAPSVASYYWFGWPLIKTAVRAGRVRLPWTEGICLGSNLYLIDFSRVPEIANV